MQDDGSAIRQEGQRLLHREKQAFHIDVEGPVVEFLGDRAESGKLRDPGIGEHNIEFALFLLDLRKQTIKVAKIRNVSLYAGYISADLLYRRSQLRLASARYEDVRAFVDKRFCRGESNAASPASNECGFSFKLVHIFPSSFYQSCQIVGTTCRRAPQPGFVCCCFWLLWNQRHITSPKLEQNLAAAIRFQGLFERFLELVERVHMFHCGGERSICYEVSQLLVDLLDLCAGRVAYPIDEPESVEAKTTVDEVSGRDGRELPTLKAVEDNRAARFKRFCQLAHGSSTHRIEDEAKFLPVEGLLNTLVKVVALEDYAVTSPLPHLFGSFFPPDEIQRLDSCKLRERNDVLPHGRVGCGLTDPVAGHQGNVSVQQEVGGSRVNPYHRQLQEIRFVAHRHEVAHWRDNLVCPGALLVGRKNQDSLSPQSNINLRSDLCDSANTLRAYRRWEGRPDAVHAADKQKV